MTWFWGLFFSLRANFTNCFGVFNDAFGKVNANLVLKITSNQRLFLQHGQGQYFLHLAWV